jgi:hypothetical protein
MKLPFFAFVLVPALVFAADEITFKGGVVKDVKSSKECFLRVSKTYFAGNTKLWEDFRAEANTGFVHGGDTPGEITLNASKTDFKKLSGRNSSENELEVALDKDETFKSATSYKLKWKHGDHFHRFYCFNLEVVTNP